MSRTSALPRAALAAALLLSALFAAPAGAAVGGFDAADGNRGCSPADAVGQDWDCLPEAAGLVTQDDATGSNDDVFTEASKVHQPGAWQVVTASTNDKTDFQRVHSAALETDDQSHLFLAFDRIGTTGSVNLSFELNQLDRRWTNSSGRSLVCRKDGDVLVSYENGGIKLYSWATATRQAGSNCPLTGTWHLVTGVVSEGTLNGAFGEAAVDLDSLMNRLGAAAEPCRYFRRLSAHSRQSPSITSALGDWVGDAPISIGACKDPDPGGEDTTPPDAPTLTIAADCQPGDVATLRGTAEPLSWVEVRRAESSEMVAAPVQAGPTGDWSVEVTLPTTGTHSFRALARDAAGNRSASSATATVDTAPPVAPTLSGPAEVAAGQDVALAGAAPQGTTVVIERNGQEIARLPVAVDGGFAHSDPAVAAGTHTYTATALDGCRASQAASTTVLARSLGGGDGDGDGGDGGGDGGDGGDGGGNGGGDGGGGGPTPTVPGQEVEGDSDAGGCSRTPFQVAIPDEKIKKVVFRIDGKKAAVVRRKQRDAEGRFALTIDPRRYSAGLHRVKARIVYTKRARRKPRTVPMRSFTACQVGQCVSRRSFKIRVRNVPGDVVKSAKVYVNGKRVKVVRGARLRARVELAGLPRGVVKVKIVSRLASGKRDVDVRTYRTCAKRKRK